jgi:hypothetical protein
MIPKKVALIRKKKRRYKRLHGTKVLVHQAVVLDLHSSHPLASLSGERAIVRTIGRRLDGVGCIVGIELSNGDLVDVFEKFLRVVV